jgi:hypothetical protein
MAAGLSRAPKQENVSSTLSSGITDVSATMDVQDASKMNYPSWMVIDRVDAAGTLKSTSLWEYVKVTNIAGNTLTITRAQGGSTQQSHSSGAVVEPVVTASQFENYYDVLNPEHTATGGHVISTATVVTLNVSGNVITSGAIVGTKGQFAWTQAGALATSLATAATDTHLGALRASKNLTLTGLWAGVSSAASTSYTEIKLEYRSTPTSAITTMLTNHLYIDVGEYTSDSAATVASLALTSLASGTLVYPSILKPGGAGDLTLSLIGTERA